MNHAGAYPNQYQQNALGQQWSEMNQQSLNQNHAGQCALGQQWSELAGQQRAIAALAKCREEFEDHTDNALRFEQYAREAFSYEPKIDYLAITRAVCGG